MEDALVSFDLCRVILTRGNLGTRVKKFVYIKYRHITTQRGQNTECESPFRVDECLCVYCKNHHTRLAFSSFSAFEKNIIFCEDFIVKDRLQGNTCPNKQGDELESVLVLLDRVSRTTSLPSDEDSVIDLEVVSPLLVPICRWVVLVYYCSDHRLCTTLVQLYYNWTLYCKYNSSKEAQEAYGKEATTRNPTMVERRGGQRIEMKK